MKKHRIWRKNVSESNSIKEWSRMLHKWWKIDIKDKLEFKKGKYEI